MLNNSIDDLKGQLETEKFLRLNADKEKSENSPTELDKLKTELSKERQTNYELLNPSGKIGSLTKKVSYLQDQLDKEKAKDKRIPGVQDADFNKMYHLVTSTCQKLIDSGVDVKDTEKVKSLCNSVSGKSNLFELFFNAITKGNTVDEHDCAKNEKRATFLLNLLSFFYSGSREPSAEDIISVL